MWSPIEKRYKVQAPIIALYVRYTTLRHCRPRV